MDNLPFVSHVYVKPTVVFSVGEVMCVAEVIENGVFV